METVVAEYSSESLLQANPSLLTSLNVVREAIHTEIGALYSLETYIHLLMPQMEDGVCHVSFLNVVVDCRCRHSFSFSPSLTGNNFGVTVQMTVLKVMEEVKEKLEKKLEELPSYYSKRADAIDKLGLPTETTSETTTSTATESKGGKDGDSNTTSNTTTKESKSSGNAKMEFHRIQHVHAIDIATYQSLQSSLAYCISSYLVILDNVSKNKSKLEQPKGSSGGSNFSSMY